MFRMVKKLLFCCLCTLILLLPGCQPEGIIPPEEMEKLFADFYRADATIELLNETSTPVELDSMRVYLPIVEASGYTKDVFRTSLDYYLHHPDRLSKIFTHVKTRLEQDANRPAQDSVEREEEGVEPAIEREEQADPTEEQKPPKLNKTRKKMTKDDLKRLEEELAK